MTKPKPCTWRLTLEPLDGSGNKFGYIFGAGPGDEDIQTASGRNACAHSVGLSVVERMALYRGIDIGLPEVK